MREVHKIVEATEDGIDLKTLYVYNIPQHEVQESKSEMMATTLC